MEKLKPIIDNLFAHKIPQDILKESHYEMFENRARQESLDTILPAKEQLRRLFDKKGKPFSNSIGVHPDFEDLEEDEDRNQYVCSVFLDISGSTELGIKFPLSTVQLYKNAILNTAIEIFQAFDGHIHRLQGDAIFAYFGHKHLKKSDAIIDALNATSVMQSYNKNTLSEFFKEIDLDPLKIRAGIDIGDDHQVLWSKYGLGETTEVTSTSIHTDLAAKLQGKASENSIMIGENVYSYVDLPDEFIKIKTFVKEAEKKEEKYIINNSRHKAYYQMRVFNWEKYLSSFSFLPKDQATIFKSPDDFEIICEVSEDQENLIPLKSNTKAIKKDANIAFKLELKKMSIRLKLKVDSITWKVINRGQEASESERDLSYYMDKYKGKYLCKQSTAYNGHHYMECSMYDSQGKLIGKDKFGIYVNDDKVKMKDIGISEERNLISK